MLRLVELTVAVSAEPVIRTGIWVVRVPVLPTTVAVRVVGSAPAANVTVALPVASVVADEALRKPLSTENVIVTPETAALDELTAVAVIVVVSLLSDLTDVCDDDSVIAAATGVTTTGVVGVVGVDVDDELPDPPPHAASSETRKTAVNSEAVRDQIELNMYSYGRVDCD